MPQIALTRLRAAEIETPAELALEAPPAEDPLLDLCRRVQVEFSVCWAQDDQVEERVFVPDPEMPGGMIWPPVDGRALLHEVSHLAIRPWRTPRGDWWGSGSGWRCHSSPGALFEDATTARNALIGWARLHAANIACVSLGRAVILADAGHGRLRLWQLVRMEVALRERLVSAFASSDPKHVATGIVEVATQLLVARSWFEQASTFLPCTLWTVGASAGVHPTFVGLKPNAIDRDAGEPAPYALLEREIGPQLRELRRARVDYAEILREVVACASSASPAAADYLGQVAAKVA